MNIAKITVCVLRSANNSVQNISESFCSYFNNEGLIEEYCSARNGVYMLMCFVELELKCENLFPKSM